MGVLEGLGEGCAGGGGEDGGVGVDLDLGEVFADGLDQSEAAAEGLGHGDAVLVVWGVGQACVVVVHVVHDDDVVVLCVVTWVLMMWGYLGVSGMYSKLSSE